jgi:ABC-2 type transport system permease protein
MGARAKLMVFAFHLLFPIVLLPVILPVAWQVICAAKGWWPGIPFHVIGSGLALTVVLVLYSLSLEWLGHLLERREKEILQVVTEEVE